MGDIKSPRLIYIKGFLFLFMGLMAVLTPTLENPNLRDTFQTHGGDTTLAHRDGQKFKLLGRTPDENYDRIEPEAGSLWRIRFEDGFETDAYGDEIAEEAR